MKYAKINDRQIEIGFTKEPETHGERITQLHRQYNMPLKRLHK